ncbi:uncharacterized protein M6B38_164225 [Iris pallida]|uniref:Uncharacterized protein n=1 Tax=Iris pallida TaxID=29817 RepID=A0AAX6EYB8_IRIPA|nr:uncharacterized protein M6B38_164225 [Iris pallida]
MVGMKIAGSNCLQWQQHHQRHSPAIHRPQPLSSSPSRRGFVNLSYRFLSRSRSLHRDGEELKIIRRSFSTALNGFTNNEEDDDDDVFVKRFQQFLLNFTTHDETTSLDIHDPPKREESVVSAEPTSSAVRPEPPSWLEQQDRDRDRDRDDEINIIPASAEHKPNSIELPLSLRIIKQKKKKEINSSFLRGAGESACCSVDKAFSSMVFILRELQSYALQMRQVLLYENLQGILSRVHGEMNASFVWLFQQIFSCTPTLMVYVMLLLANFTVHSIGSNYALAAASPNPTHQSVAIVEQDYQQQQTDTRTDTWSTTETFSIGSRTASVDGYSGGGGGGTTKPAAGAADGGSHYGNTGSGAVVPEEEAAAWNRMVEEATRMQAVARDGSLMDHDTLRSFVSPVGIEVEQEDYEEYSKTEMMYHRALALDPDNALLLSNFAQFLYLVLHDHNRAEYYFKRAVGMKPADAESLSRYASFLWLARKDMGAAEEAYLEAVAAEPSNAYYAANYAHFLWNTGGEDTCYPLDGGAC